MAEEPTFDDIYKQFYKDPLMIPSEFLLDPANGFVNKQRATFLMENQGYMRAFVDLIVSGLNFYSAPESIRSHYMYPDSKVGGPVAIFVGGASMNIFEGISLGSTDIDIDLLPLVNSRLELIPIYKADHTLTQEYQEYFDWLLDTVANLVDANKLMVSSMKKMVERNIQANIEVMKATTFAKKSSSIPGEIRRIKVVGEGKYILAQIINDQFFSKVAVWILLGDELERIVEFKLLTKVPDATKYEPAVLANGLWKPTRQTYIENALETLNYRLDALQRDVLDYNETLRKIFLLPETYLLAREESLRKKLLSSKMRIHDVFERLYALFYGVRQDQQSLKLLLSFYHLIIQKQNQVFFNKVAMYELQHMTLSRFPNFTSIPYFILLETAYLYPKKLLVEQQYNASLKSIYERKAQALKDGIQFDKLTKQLANVDSFRQQQRAQQNKQRQLNLEKAIEKEEAAKKEDIGLTKKEVEEVNENVGETLALNSNSNSNENEGKGKGKEKPTSVSPVSERTGSPANNRSGSPGYYNDSEREQQFTEMFREEQEREVQELFDLMQNVGKSNDKEVEAKVTNLFTKQKVIRDEKLVALKKREEAEREAKKEKRKKQVEKEQAFTALKAKRTAENNALLANLEKKRETENLIRKQVQEKRNILFYLESPNYYPNHYNFDVYQTFMPAIFFESDVRAPLIGYKFPDFTHSLRRDELFTDEEFATLPEMDQLEPIPENEFTIIDEMVEMRILANLNEYSLTTILFTFEDLNSEVIMTNIKNVGKILMQLCVDYLDTLHKKFYATAYQQKFYEEIYGPIQQIMKSIGELEANIIKLQLIYKSGGQKKKEIDSALAQMDIQMKTSHSQLLNISVGFATFLFPILTQCKGNKLPSIPSLDEFNAVYKPLTTLTMGSIKKTKLVVEKYHRALFEFEQKVFIYHSACTINYINDSKIQKFKGLEVDPPILVLTTIPAPYRNPIAAYDSSLKPVNFSFFENLYIALKENNFTFFEEYPLFKEFIKIHPEYSEPFLNSLLKIDEDSKIRKDVKDMKKMKIRQSVEINLLFSRVIWKDLEENYGGEVQKTMFKRFTIFLVKVTQENYVLNAFSQWEKIKIFLEAKENGLFVYSEDDLSEIASIMVTRWKHFYAIRFLVAVRELPPGDKILRTLPYERGLVQVNKRILKEIETFMVAKALSLGTSVPEGKKGGSRSRKRFARKTRKVYRKKNYV